MRQDQKDWNFQKTFTGRASLLFKPTDAFSAEVAVLHSGAQGDGGPQVNPDFPGGTSPLDPATILPPGGRYREFSQIDQPWSRYTNLVSLDLSYDAGFATGLPFVRPSLAAGPISSRFALPNRGAARTTLRLALSPASAVPCSALTACAFSP